MAAFIDNPVVRWVELVLTGFGSLGTTLAVYLWWTRPRFRYDAAGRIMGLDKSKKEMSSVGEDTREQEGNTS
jgi:hypothetical protein